MTEELLLPEEIAEAIGGRNEQILMEIISLLQLSSTEHFYLNLNHQPYMSGDELKTQADVIRYGLSFLADCEKAAWQYREYADDLREFLAELMPPGTLK